MARRRPGRSGGGGGKDVSRILNRGYRHHRRGDLKRAEQSYRKVLSIQPDHPDALQFLGAIALSRGDGQRAVAYLERALALVPKAPGLHCNLGIALAATGDIAQARARFAGALALDPAHKPAHLSRIKLEAVAGDRDRCLQSLDQADVLFAGDVEVLLEGAASLGRLGETDAALARARRAQGAEPSARTQLAVGRALEGVGDPHAAIDAYRAALGHDARFPHARAQLAYALERIDDREGARSEATTASELPTDRALATVVLARIERRAGELDQAHSRLVALTHDFGAASTDDRALIYNELGHCEDRRGAYDDAWRAFAMSNTLRRDQLGDLQAAQQQTLDLLEASHALLDGPAPAPPPDDGLPVPVFLVGFPRSGTTLVEQIVAAHPAFRTSDELTAIGRVAVGVGRDWGEAPYPGGLAALTTADLGAMRSAYWAHMRAGRGDGVLEGRFLDKLPLNILYLPLVHALFPDAPIVCVHREPRDACLSAFMQHFQLNAGMLHMLDLHTTAAFFAAVMRFALACRDRLGAPWLDLRYEDLVDDLPGTGGRLMSFLGERWTDEMATFYVRAGAAGIATPSYQDVAQPIYRRAVQRWRNYAAQLAPVEATLAPFVSSLGYADPS